MGVCPSCGHENPDTARFCNACAAPLKASPPSAGREERKVVTVLFADLVGFTARAEQLDPEDVRALLAPYHAHLRAELERYGGTVEKFIGDAVMALFGAPAAHEDDPVRAGSFSSSTRTACRSWMRPVHLREPSMRCSLATATSSRARTEAATATGWTST
jgi:class 3 adenylate cyclase